MTPMLRPGDAVVVAPVAAEALLPGDWVILRNGFLHRYLGRRGNQVLTKGDGHLGFDPLWQPDAVMGRVVEASRDGRCFYRRTAGQVTRQRLLTAWHWSLGSGWEVLRRLKAWWLSLLLTALLVSGVVAAVTVDEFYAVSDEEKIVLHWHTASESQNAGFRIERSTQETGGYVDISDPIDSKGDLIGAYYVYTDSNVTPGVLYYYKLWDVPYNSGDTLTPTGPITATLRSATGTVTPTATLTPTITLTPSPTPTPNPHVRFEADKTDLIAGECTVVRWVTAGLKAVYLDSRGVVGEGNQTFCPCATEDHILDIIYQDGSGDQFTLTLNVTGSCQAGTSTLTPLPSLTPTPSPEGGVATETATPRPTATATPISIKGDLPTVTPLASPTVTPSPRATPLPTLTTGGAAVDTAPPSPAPTSRVTATRLVVEGEIAPVRLTNTTIYIVLLILGIVVGLGFIGSGAWLWRRRQ